jgi:hypothetical protein
MQVLVVLLGTIALLGCSDGSEPPFGSGSPDREVYGLCMPMHVSGERTAWMGTGFFLSGDGVERTGLRPGTIVQFERIDYEAEDLVVLDVSMRREGPYGAELFEDSAQRSRRREELGVQSLPTEIVVEPQMHWSLAVEVGPESGLDVGASLDQEVVIGRFLPTYVNYRIDGTGYRSPLHGEYEVAMSRKKSLARCPERDGQ